MSIVQHISGNRRQYDSWLSLGGSIMLICCSCNKEAPIKPYSFVNVKFAEVEDYVFIETAEGSWNYQTSIAKISGAGYNHEEIYIYLPSLTDTGDYPNAGISNISYTDGLDFVANGFSGG